MLIAVCRYDVMFFIFIKHFHSTSFEIPKIFCNLFSMQSMAILNNAEFLQSECKSKDLDLDRIIIKRQAQEPGTPNGA